LTRYVFAPEFRFLFIEIVLRNRFAEPIVAASEKEADGQALHIGKTLRLLADQRAPTVPKWNP
jgi:hypothetical protein